MSESDEGKQKPVEEVARVLCAYDCDGEEGMDGWFALQNEHYRARAIMVVSRLRALGLFADHALAAIAEEATSYQPAAAPSPIPMNQEEKA